MVIILSETKSPCSTNIKKYEKKSIEFSHGFCCPQIFQNCFTFLAWLLMGFCMECGVKGHFISFWNEKANKQRLYSIPSTAMYVLLGCNGEFISVDTQCIVKTLYSIIPSFFSSLHIKGEMVLQPLFGGEGSWLPRPMLQWFSQSYRRTVSNFVGFQEHHTYFYVNLIVIVFISVWWCCSQFQYLCKSRHRELSKLPTVDYSVIMNRGLPDHVVHQILLKYFCAIFLED